MCVIVAILLPRDPATGKPLPNATWYLAKIRDRPYVPTVELLQAQVSGSRTMLSFRDADTRWAEGICFGSSGTPPLALVNSALSNMDKYEIKLATRAADKKRAFSKSYDHGDQILSSLSSPDIETTVKKIAEYRLMGHTFVSDGRRLFWLEIFVPIQLTNDMEEKVRNRDPSLDKVAVMLEARKMISKRQMVVNIIELTHVESGFHVRTNHTIGAQGFGGYQSEGFSKLSTLRRLQYTEEVLRATVFDKYSLISSLRNLGSSSIDPEPFFRPIRFMDKSVPVFSTMQIIFDVANPQMEIVPINGMVQIKNKLNDNSCLNPACPPPVVIHEPIKREKFTDIARTQGQKALICGLASTAMYLFFLIVSPQSAKDSITEFWNSDRPLLDGPMRIFFYSVLLLVFFTSGFSSCLKLSTTLQKMDNRFRKTPGVFSWCKPEWMTVDRAFFLERIAIACWVLSILGFGGQIPPIITAVAVFILQGFDQGCRGLNHRWYIPLYTLIALAASDGRSTHSLDAVFSEIFVWYPFPVTTQPSLLLSGFSRKFLLVSVCSTFTLGAASKLMNAGIRWMDGYTLIFNCDHEFGASPWLKKLILKYRPFAMFLSVSSVVFELSWILGPFFSVTVIPLVAASVMFHLGIYMAMSPNYLPQSVCYILLVDWNFVGRTLGIISTEVENATIPVADYTLAMIVLSHMAMIFCVFMIFVMIFRIEAWPITSIPMYSTYRGVDHSRKFLRNFDQLRQEVQFHITKGYPETITWGRDWFKVWIINPNTVKSNSDLPFRFSVENYPKDKVFPIESYVHTHGIGAPDKQRWLSILFSYVSRDITDRFDNGLFPRKNNPQSYGVQYLFLIREILYSYTKLTALFPNWVHECGELQLVCNLSDGWIVLASVPWCPSGVGKLVNFTSTNKSNVGQEKLVT